MAEESATLLKSSGNLFEKRQQTNRRREFDGLQSALRRFGLKAGTIVTLDQTDFAVENGYEINIVSAAEYFMGSS